MASFSMVFHASAKMVSASIVLGMVWLLLSLSRSDLDKILANPSMALWLPVAMVVHVGQGGHELLAYH